MIIKKKYVYVLLLIVAVGLVLAIMRWNDYREKELVDVLDWEDIEEFVYLEPNPDGPLHYEEIPVAVPEKMEELKDFLSQYQVKKIGYRQFTTEHPDEQFHFQPTYADERITIPSMIEWDVLLIDDYQYTITNGPVDYGWVEDFFEIEN